MVGGPPISTRILHTSAFASTLGMDIRYVAAVDVVGTLDFLMGDNRHSHPHTRHVVVRCHTVAGLTSRRFTWGSLQKSRVRHGVPGRAMAGVKAESCINYTVQPCMHVP